MSSELTWNSLPDSAVKTILRFLSATDIRNLETSVIKYNFKLSDAYWEKYQISSTNCDSQDKSQFLDFIKSLNSTLVSFVFHKHGQMDFDVVASLGYLKELTVSNRSDGFLFRKTAWRGVLLGPNNFQYLQTLACTGSDFVKMCNVIPSVTRLKLYVNRGDNKSVGLLSYRFQEFLECHNLKHLSLSSKSWDTILCLLKTGTKYPEELEICIRGSTRHFPSFGRSDAIQLAQFVEFVNPKILKISTCEGYCIKLEYEALTNLKVFSMRVGVKLAILEQIKKRLDFQIHKEFPQILETPISPEDQELAWLFLGCTPNINDAVSTLANNAFQITIGVQRLCDQLTITIRAKKLNL